MATLPARAVTLVVGSPTKLSRSVTQGLAVLDCPLVLTETIADGGYTSGSDLGRDVRAILRRGGQAIIAHHDPSTPAGADAAIDVAVEAFGSVDAVVVIGEQCRTRAFLRIDPQSWTALIASHLDTAFFTCQAAARWMVAHRRPGRLICVTAATGVSTIEFGRVHLTGVVGGIFSLVRAMAIELRPKGITVNAIAPSVTEPAEEMPSQCSSAAGDDMGNIMSLIAFLLSGNAKEITGQVISVDEQKLSIIRPVKSAGAVAEGHTWSPEEIARRWAELSR